MLKIKVKLADRFGNIYSKPGAICNNILAFHKELNMNYTMTNQSNFCTLELNDPQVGDRHFIFYNALNNKTFNESGSPLEVTYRVIKYTNTFEFNTSDIMQCTIPVIFLILVCVGGPLLIYYFIEKRHAQLRRK